MSTMFLGCKGKSIISKTMQNVALFVKSETFCMVFATIPNAMCVNVVFLSITWIPCQLVVKADGSSRDGEYSSVSIVLAIELRAHVV